MATVWWEDVVEEILGNYVCTCDCVFFLFLAFSFCHSSVLPSSVYSVPVYGPVNCAFHKCLLHLNIVLFRMIYVSTEPNVSVSPRFLNIMLNVPDWGINCTSVKDREGGGESEWDAHVYMHTYKVDGGLCVWFCLCFYICLKFLVCVFQVMHTYKVDSGLCVCGFVYVFTFVLNSLFVFSRPMPWNQNWRVCFWSWHACARQWSVVVSHRCRRL